MQLLADALAPLMSFQMTVMGLEQVIHLFFSCCEIAAFAMKE